MSASIRLQTRKRQQVDCNSEAEENLQRNAAVQTSNFPNDKSFKALPGVNKNPGVNLSKVVSYEGLSWQFEGFDEEVKENVGNFVRLEGVSRLNNKILDFYS